MMKRLNAVLLAMLLSASGVVMGAGAAAGSTPSAATESVIPTKSAVKQLRGKLLYKRNQIRKLEGAACAADTELQSRVEALESERQGLYVAAEPKLGELYAAEKDLEAQIQTLTKK